jgi:hypothetical protein
VAKDGDGSVERVEPGALANPGGIDLGVWEGASSSLLDQSDLDKIGSSIQPGSVAAIVVYENAWIMSMVDAWRRGGARLISDGGIRPGSSCALSTRPSRCEMGLLSTAAKAAVASSVHGRVQRRQQRRWAEQDASAAAAHAPAPGPVEDDTDRKLAQLAKLGELRELGVLTDAEFEAQKAQILQA